MTCIVGLSRGSWRSQARPLSRCTGAQINQRHQRCSNTANPGSYNWNAHEEFFHFTRGRFVYDEAENLKMRSVRFDMNRLAQVSADAVGAPQCVSIQKFADGMFNKAFLLTMSDGQEVVAKIPNPNAGISHLTTASEVATLDFARNVLKTPAPQVYAWNSRAASSPIGAEYIIMEKIPGVPVSLVWHKMKLVQKLKVLFALTEYNKKWLDVSFSHIGSLFYSKDVDRVNDAYYIKEGQRIDDSRFTIGPAVGRDWIDAGRSALKVDRGPFCDASQYLAAIADRETAAVRSLQPPRQTVVMCGPKLYRPDAGKKLLALSWFQQIMSSLIPTDPSLTRVHLWHNDLHDDNIFIDPSDLETITGIIDWQSAQLQPLFNQRPDAAFLDYDGLEPETLERPPNPDLKGLSKEEKAIKMEAFSKQAVFVGWRQLMQRTNPALYRSVEFRKTASYGLITLARRMFEYGEAHFRSLIVDMKDTWGDTPMAKNGKGFPIDFTQSEVNAMKSDGDAAVAGTELAETIKARMEDLWPDKGMIEHDKYDAAKASLREIKIDILKAVANSEEEKAEFEQFWPFDDSPGCTRLESLAPRLLPSSPM